MASLPLEPDLEQDHAWLLPAAPAGDPDGVSVVDWRDFASATAIAEWDELTLGASDPNPFFESWNLLPALVNLDRDGNAQIAIYRSQGKLRGLMPVARVARYYGYPLPHMRNWLHHNSFCGTPLVSRGYEIGFWTALLDWADQNPGGAMFLHLTNLPDDGAVYAALRQVTAGRHRPSAVVHREQRAMLQSNQSPEDYFDAAMSAKKRKELRRQHNRLSEEGTLRFHRHDDDYKIDQWCDDFLALEQAGWKGSEGSALACDPATASLFRIAMHGAATRGRAERLSLSLDGKPIAMLVNFLASPGSFSFKTAFDKSYARFSPGVLLQRENLALLGRKDIAWSDSCAAADHPMIERIWREKRNIVRANIGIGGSLRRTLFRQILRAESGGGTDGL